tara:strand:+ start:706 stop:1947 length:1242 start_codon:yes stop_codon:yes gene_type:complete
MSDINLSISSGTNVVTTVIESQNTISINPTASITPTSLLGLTDVNASSITNGQILSYDSSSGTFTASTVSSSNTTYSVSCVDGDNSDEEKIRLTDSDGGTDDVVIEAGTGMSIARSGDKITLTNTVTDSDTNTTYSVSCVDGDNSDEEKIRLTDSGGGTDDVVLEAGTGLSIARSSDKITLTNTVTDTNTQLSTEAVQDIVGGMFSSNTETRVSATYQDADGTIDLVVDDMTADTQLTTEAVQDIVGGMFTGNTETGIAATYQDGDGTIDLAVSGTEITSTKVSIDNTAVLAMKYNNTPVTLKAAEAGKIIMPVNLLVVGTHAGANESSSDNLQMGWDAASSTTSDYYFYSRDWMNGVTSGTKTSFSGGPDNGSSANMYDFSFVNKPFQAWCSDVFNGGWSMDIYFSYYMIDE